MKQAAKRKLKIAGLIAVIIAAFAIPIALFDTTLFGVYHVGDKVNCGYSNTWFVFEGFSGGQAVFSDNIAEVTGQHQTIMYPLNSGDTLHLGLIEYTVKSYDLEQQSITLYGI
jgi:hypothetical protein